MPEPTIDHRRAVAERNLEAILDAAERLLERRAQASITAVATEAGLSRVTVYAHYKTRVQLLEAVVARAVERAAVALEEADPESGPPLEALDRMIAVAWRDLDRNAAIAQATADQLTPAAMARSHQAAFRSLHKLVARGRDAGAFRTDVPGEWLITSCFALVHACGDEVRAGKLKAADAPGILQATLRDVFAGGTDGVRPQAARRRPRREAG
ncbi:MAG: regulatory protein TetR [Solirubrobacterales bacterium]|nr:regulatory protein TetR [Solirubrobacterales bacterium]